MSVKDFEKICKDFEKICFSCKYQNDETGECKLCKESDINNNCIFYDNITFVVLNIVDGVVELDTKPDGVTVIVLDNDIDQPIIFL